MRAERANFTTYHPALVAMYALVCLGFSVATQHPVYVAVSLCASCGLCAWLCGGARLRGALKLGIPTFLLVAVINPLFNHRGLTPLFSLFGNPITLEAIVYGACAGGMLLSAMVWCGCLAALLPPERMLFLLGKRLPTTALLLSMIFRALPLMTKRARQIQIAGFSLYGDAPGDRRRKLRRSLRMCGALLCWSMEDGLCTADSMRARGYGCCRRVRSARAVWRAGDTAAACALCVGLGLSIFGATRMGFAFYPRLSFASAAWWGYCVYAALLLLPAWVQCVAWAARHITSPQHPPKRSLPCKPYR